MSTANTKSVVRRLIEGLNTMRSKYQALLDANYQDRFTNDVPLRDILRDIDYLALVVESLYEPDSVSDEKTVNDDFISKIPVSKL